MKRRSYLLGFILLIGSLATISSCKKDNTTTGSGTAQVGMHLTDGPSAAYDHIYLDIRQIEVTMTGSSAITLTPTYPGVYDMLQFRNGLDTLLMRATLPAGTIGQMRLLLGDNSSVVVNGVSYPLATPSAQESGLKLNLNQTFVANGSYDIWLDFDAARSIIQTGNGAYKLKPVVRAYSALTNGSIKGYVLPNTSLSVVYAINGTDTLTAIPNSTDGFFRINGMPSGTYSVLVQPGIAGLSLYTRTNVTVTYGTLVDLGNITLQP